MKKALKIVVLTVVIGLVVIQFFGIDRVNPPIMESETLEAAVSVPSDVSQILSRSCNDCHSHKTAYPWYAYIQPSGWFLEDHILVGRNEMNFSKFNTYEHKRKVRKLEEICQEVESKAMPLPTYLWLHGEADLNDSERKVLCDWSNGEREKLLALAPVS